MPSTNRSAAHPSSPLIYLLTLRQSLSSKSRDHGNLPPDDAVPAVCPDDEDFTVATVPLRNVDGNGFGNAAADAIVDVEDPGLVGISFFCAEGCASKEDSVVAFPGNSMFPAEIKGITALDAMESAAIGACAEEKTLAPMATPATSIAPAPANAPTTQTLDRGRCGSAFITDDDGKGTTSLWADSEAVWRVSASSNAPEEGE